jgi:AcrR family transcriptional regulator
MERAGGTLRDQQRQFTRSRLLEAARTVMVERGYLATTIEDIASEAGASRATFYLHFSGKAEVVEALIENGVASAVERYKALDLLLVDDGPGARDAFRGWLSAWLGIWAEGTAAQAAFTQAAAMEPSVERRLMATTPILVDALEHAPWRRPGMPPEEAARLRDRALMLELMTQRVFQVVSAGLMAFPEAALIDFLLELWWDVFHHPRQG